MKTYSTHNGKEIVPVIDNRTGKIKIQFGSGGELPEELSGLYTSEKYVAEAVNKYLEKTKSRKKEE